MYIYYLVILLVSLPGIYVKSKKQTDLYFIWVFLILFLVSAMRGHEVGGDLLRYLPVFDEVASSSFIDLFSDYDKYGLIFKLYIKISSLITNEPSWYLFTTSFYNLIIPLYFLKKYCKIPWLGVFLYITLAYYTNTFNSIRVSMSLACSMVGVSCLINNKPWRAFFIFLIALEIHKTIAPVFLLFVLKKITPSFWIIIIPIICSVAIARILETSGIMNLILLYNTMNNYNTAEVEILEHGNSGGYGLLALYIFLTLGLYFIIRNKKQPLESFLLMTICLATCIQAMAPLYSFITRITSFFSIYLIVLIPNVIYKYFTKESRKYCICALLVPCMIYFKIFIMTPSDDFEFRSNSQCTIPYYFFWENKPKI